MRLSPFLNNVLVGILLISFFIFTLFIPSENFEKMLILPSIVLLWMWLLDTSSEISDSFVYKYKIYKDKLGYYDCYKIHPSSICFLIPIKKRMNTTTSSYQYENLFGAKRTDYGSSVEFIKDINEIHKLIEDDRKSVNSRYESFFSKPEPKDCKVIKF